MQLSTFALALAALAVCAVGLGTVYSGTGHSYYVVNSVGTYTTLSSARAAAQALGTGWDLVSITSSGEQSFLVSILPAPLSGGTINEYYTGGVGSGSSWSWLNGDPFSYSYWGTGEPNYGSCTGRIFLDNRMQYPNWGWNDACDSQTPASLYLGYVAEGPAPPSLLTSGTCGSHTYRVYSKSSAQFSDALAQAAELGSGWYPATMTDAAENSCVQGILSTHAGEYWIGMTRTGPNSPSNWKWNTGEGYCYRNWNPGEPSGDGVNAIMYGGSDSRAGKWNDEGNIGLVTGFVLEYGDLVTGSFCCPYVLDQCDSIQAICDSVSAQQSVLSPFSSDTYVQPIYDAGSTLLTLCNTLVTNCHNLHDSTCC